MGHRVFRASALAAVLVIVVYFATPIFGGWLSSWRLLFLFDLAVYLGIGFFAARYLSDWRRAMVVVTVAALVDGVLAVGSVALLDIPPLSVAQVARIVPIEIAINIVTGTIGAIVAAVLARNV